MGNFKEDIAKVKAFVFDVDGVFTNGSLTMDGSGELARTYYAKDGYAVSYALKMGYKVCIITGGRGVSIDKRFELLGVTKVYAYCKNKVEKLNEFLAEHNLEAKDILYMGDDIPDLDAMRMVGMPVCPNDAAPEIIEASRYVSQYGGGRGCIRDVVEQVLRAHGNWANSNPDASLSPSA
ncbi:MAG: HAD hydrolase family protein [Rikenellaceae bacterium]